jgi:hypothetical protein
MRDAIDKINQLWQRIEARLAMLASPTAPNLVAGASDQALDRLEVALGVVLPEKFRASYIQHDGGGRALRLARWPHPARLVEPPLGSLCRRSGGQSRLPGSSSHRGRREGTDHRLGSRVRPFACALP